MFWNWFHLVSSWSKLLVQAGWPTALPAGEDLAGLVKDLEPAKIKKIKTFTMFQKPAWPPYASMTWFPSRVVSEKPRHADSTGGYGWLHALTVPVGHYFMPANTYRVIQTSFWGNPTPSVLSTVMIEQEDDRRREREQLSHVTIWGLTQAITVSAWEMTSSIHQTVPTWEREKDEERLQPV